MKTLGEIAERLEVGTWYRFVYVRTGGRVWDECIAQYLGVNGQTDEVVLNLRPLAGTSTLRPEQVVHAYRSKVNEPKLPKRSSMQPGNAV